MADRVLVAPPGITRPDQFAERNTQRMPTPPRPANTLVVGGPAYFTPEGYQAPVQPTQSFMPTNVAPDPIRDQFNRQLPPIQRPQPPMPAPPPTGGVGDPAPYVPAPAPAPQYDVSTDPMPDPVQSYIDVNGNLQFGEPPSFTMEPYSMEPEPVFEPTPTPAPEPVFTPPPTMPEPNGFFPNMNFEDLDLSGLPNFTMPPPPPPPPSLAEPTPAPSYIPEGMSEKMAQLLTDKGIDLADENYLYQPRGLYGGRERYIGLPQPTGPNPNYVPPANAPTKSIREALATPAPIYTPPPKMEEMFEDYDYGNPNLRDRGMFGPRR